VAAFDSAISGVDQIQCGLSRDNLDENGGGKSELEAAAGSEGMIILSAKLRKHFFSMPLFDCR
jgi:hypothetical protein